jgi:hypothetical protein
MEFSKISKRAKVIRLILVIYYCFGILTIIFSLYNNNWLWVVIFIFFSGWGFYFALLNEHEALPNNSKEAANIAGICFISISVGFFLGILFIIFSLLDPQIPILMSSGFIIWGLGSLICLKRNIVLFREFQCIKGKK